MSGTCLTRNEERRRKLVASVHKVAILTEDFQNSQRNYKVESSFRQVEDLISAAFLKMNSTTDVYLKFLQNNYF